MRLFLVILLALTALRMPEPAPDAGDLAAGIRQVESGDYRTALITLDAVVRRLSGDPARKRDLATAHLYAGAAALGTGQSDRASSEMREAARLEPGLTPDAKSLSSEAVALYEKERGHAGKSSKTVPIVVAAGAVAAGGVALAASGGSSASPTTQPFGVTPPTSPVPPPPTPPPTTPRGPLASAFDIHLQGAGTAERHEVTVGSGTLTARFEGTGSEVQVIVNDALGTNVAVDTTYESACKANDKLNAEVHVPVVAGTYSVFVKVGQDVKAACCRLPNCGCAKVGSPSCFFANGQVSIFYPAP